MANDSLIREVFTSYLGQSAMVSPPASYPQRLKYLPKAFHDMKGSPIHLVTFHFLYFLYSYN
jgi:hypothetical protein